jgi:hypothetical protein
VRIGLCSVCQQAATDRQTDRGRIAFLAGIVNVVPAMTAASDFVPFRVSVSTAVCECWGPRS